MWHGCMILNSFQWTLYNDIANAADMILFNENVRKVEWFEIKLYCSLSVKQCGIKPVKAVSSANRILLYGYHGALMGWCHVKVQTGRNSSWTTLSWETSGWEGLCAQKYMSKQPSHFVSALRTVDIICNNGLTINRHDIINYHKLLISNGYHLLLQAAGIQITDVNGIKLPGVGSNKIQNLINHCRSAL